MFSRGKRTTLEKVMNNWWFKNKEHKLLTIFSWWILISYLNLMVFKLIKGEFQRQPSQFNPLSQTHIPIQTRRLNYISMWLWALANGAKCFPMRQLGPKLFCNFKFQNLFTFWVQIFISKCTLLVLTITFECIKVKDLFRTSPFSPTFFVGEDRCWPSINSST